MAIYFSSKSFCFFRKYSNVLLAFSFAVGFVFGVCVANRVDIDLLTFIQMASSHKASLPALLFVTTTPLLASCMAVYTDRQWILYIVSLLDAFSWSFCSYLVLIAYGAAGWLIHILILFSSNFLNILLCWFSLHYISGAKKCLIRNGIFAVLLSIIICCIDYCFVSPCLVNLIAYYQ